MDTYALIGKTLKHSFSKQYFDEKFLAESISDTQFLNVELEVFAQFPNFLTQLRKNKDSLKGFCITIPYKQTILPYLSWKDPVVQATQACNCVKIIEDKFYGYNTDVIGFERSLSRHLKIYHTAALILGTGGAAQAAAFVLTNKKIPFLFVSRTPSKTANSVGYNELSKLVIEKYLLIINATPTGTFPNIQDAPPISYNYLTPQHYLFDMVYNPPLTKFLELGKATGCTIQNGYEMLRFQAEENWKIWNMDNPK